MVMVDSSLKTEELVRCFNKRERAAFGQVYLLFYDELVYFSSKLFRETEMDPADVVQDIVMKVWEKREIHFNSLEHIKAYLYVSIRNHFQNYLSHKNITNKYAEGVKLDNDYLMAKIVETETLSGLSRVLGVLPTECAKVFKLYLEGWEVKDIAKELGKSPSTIYNQRQEAVDILKNLDIKKLLSMVLLFTAIQKRTKTE